METPQWMRTQSGQMAEALRRYAADALCTRNRGLKPDGLISRSLREVLTRSVHFLFSEDANP